jgi:hypothetical protein
VLLKDVLKRSELFAACGPEAAPHSQTASFPSHTPPAGPGHFPWLPGVLHPPQNFNTKLRAGWFGHQNAAPRQSSAYPFH